MKGSRLLRKLIPGCGFTGSAAPPYLAFATGAGATLDNGWEIVVNDTPVPYLVYRTYFDIEGWSQEELSAFISGAGFQESDRFIVNDPSTGEGTFAPELLTWDIVSKTHLPDSILQPAAWTDGTGFFGWNAPGMTFSNYNLEEIFAGRFRQFLPNIQLNNVVQQTDEKLWGAGDATAGNRIHVTRVVSPFLMIKDNSTVGFVPPMAVIVPAVLADEKDLVYMERLRRSYVLAESRNA